jgi:site-specific DNA recombinase
VLKGDGRSLTEIAAAQGIGDSYAGRLLRLSFLAADIIEAILTGKQPVDLTANRLANTPEIPVDWAAQRTLILGADG